MKYLGSVLFTLLISAMVLTPKILYAFGIVSLNGLMAILIIYTLVFAFILWMLKKNSFNSNIKTHERKNKQKFSYKIFFSYLLIVYLLIAWFLAIFKSK